MRRRLQPELLDSLPPQDPQAIASRADLRRLNFLMGHAGYLMRAFFGLLPTNRLPSRPLRVIELGAGDGTLLLRLARRWSTLGVKAEVTLIDRQLVVSSETQQGFADLDWSLNCVASDVFSWLKSTSPKADVLLANLFLHHFEDESLTTLLRLAAARTNLFIACEPRRSAFALTAAHSLALIGCNAVTRHDAVVSVRAGFAGQELSALWPATTEWKLSEHFAGPFSHGFSARRNV
jgi:hypothetical protein